MNFDTAIKKLESLPANSTYAERAKIVVNDYWAQREVAKRNAAFNRKAQKEAEKREAAEAAIREAKRLAASERAKAGWVLRKEQQPHRELDMSIRSMGRFFRRNFNPIGDNP